MKVVDSLNEILEMVGGSISDVSSCEDDLKHLEEDFRVRYLEDYEEPLSEETTKMLNKIKADFLQFRKRTYVKTVFQYVEGILFAMKRVLLEYSDQLTAKEIINLQEFKLSGPSTDKLDRIPNWMSLDKNFRFTIRKFEKLKTNNYKTDLNCKEWTSFKEGIQIRNRITHPKFSQDLEITDDELNKVKSVNEWFFKVIYDLQKAEVK